MSSFKNHKSLFIPVAVLVLLIASIGLFGGNGSVFAIDGEGIFELDRNAKNDVPAAVAGDDWDDFIDGTVGDNDSAIATTGILFDDIGRDGDVTFFTGGGSKDVHDVSAWLATTNDEAPDKDDLVNAFASAYSATVGQAGGNSRMAVDDTIVYFGSDRFAQNGSSQMGFWFLQNATCLKSNGTFGAGAIDPSDPPMCLDDSVGPVSHADGDILVLSNFVRGGRVDEVDVYEWLTAGGGSDGNLDLISGDLTTDQDGVDCVADTLVNDTVCGTVNQRTPVTDVPAGWTYKTKKGDGTTFPQGAFYEGGINISFYSPGICLSSFVAETRTSHSADARLKDFVLHEFNTCTGSKSGTKFEDLDGDGDVTNDGPSELSGWTIKLYQDLNNNGVLDVGAEVTSAVPTTTVTLVEAGTLEVKDSNGVDLLVGKGDYAFGDLVFGDYIVCEVLVAGWQQTFPTTSEPDDADCASQSGDATLVSLSSELYTLSRRLVTVDLPPLSSSPPM